MSVFQFGEFEGDGSKAMAVSSSPGWRAGSRFLSLFKILIVGNFECVLNAVDCCLSPIHNNKNLAVKGVCARKATLGYIWEFLRERERERESRKEQKRGRFWNENPPKTSPPSLPMFPRHWEDLCLTGKMDSPNQSRKTCPDWSEMTWAWPKIKTVSYRNRRGQLQNGHNPSS